MVDISESGMAVMLMTEVPLGEVVELEATLPLGRLEIEALVRQRNAFRYGLKFVEHGFPRELIASTCRQLAAESSNPIR